jgi:chaperonin cofactor prefoldin
VSVKENKEELNEKIETLNSQNTNKDKKITELNKKIETLNSQNTNKDKEITKLKEELVTVLKALAKFKENKDKEITKLRKDLETLLKDLLTIKENKDGKYTKSKSLTKIKKLFVKDTDIKETILKSELFDELYYLGKNRDARLSELSAIEHFCTIGIKEDREINSSFDTKWYKNHYLQDSKNTQYPIVHYILHGMKNNHPINESEKALKKTKVVTLSKAEKAKEDAELFVLSEEEKAEYYKLQKSGLFDVEFYRNSYEDLKDLDDNFNFLLHYILTGKAEGRECNGEKSE